MALPLILRTSLILEPRLSANETLAYIALISRLQKMRTLFADSFTFGVYFLVHIQGGVQKTKYAHATKIKNPDRNQGKKLFRSKSATDERTEPKVVNSAKTKKLTPCIMTQLT